MRFIVPRALRDMPFTPGDWLVLSVIGCILALGLYWFLGALSFTFTSEVPARGGAYAEGIVGTPRFLHPLLALSEADRDVVQLVFSGLMRTEPSGALVPDLAETYTLSDDQRTYTFVIRSDARFHDDTPVTADDVAFTVELAQDPGLKSPKRAHWEGVKVSVIDERTVSFTLKEPYAPFLENTKLGIIPKHLWHDVSVDEMPFATLNMHPVGSGPYALERVDTTAAGIPSSMHLRAFADGVRVPYLDTITLTFFADTDALEKAAANDTSLGAHSVSPTALPEHRAHQAMLARAFSVFLNQNQFDVFADKSVRVALDRALDKKAMIDILISGYGVPLSGPLPPTEAGATETLTPDERLSSARNVLTSAGWTLGEDGVFEKKSKKATKRLAFTLVTGTAPELKGAATFVRDAWRALGVDVQTEFLDAPDLQQNVIRPRKYAALLFGEVTGRDTDLFAFWDSSQRNDPGLNIALYTNNAVDALLKEARTSHDPQVRREKTEHAAEIISTELGALFLYSPYFVYLTPPEVHGIELGLITTPSDRFSNVASWYRETERVWPLFE
jgi:peptide/nickel transport system substrate-binding protein